MLLVCLLDMPYGYYQLVRIVSFVLSGYFAYTAYRRKRIITLLIFIIAGLLFNPIVKVALGIAIWQIVDIIYAGILIMFLITDLMKNKTTTTNTR
ncbi:MAG: hypothetical protein ACI87N_002390 [Flavobacteriales bacterium]|jgi:hypothetical protein